MWPVDLDVSTLEKNRDPKRGRAPLVELRSAKPRIPA